MRRHLSAVVLMLMGGISAWCSPDSAQRPPDVSLLTAESAEKFQDTTVCVRGVVASVCNDGGSFIDIVPISGAGHGVLVTARDGSFTFPKDSAGKIALVKGTFYGKIYPFYRLQQWYRRGWRVSENTPPRFAKVFRIQADSVSFSEPANQVEVIETPLEPYDSPVIDIDRAEFEAAQMGTGKKCLDPGEDTPEHSSGRYHELLIVLEGELTVRVGKAADEVRLSPGKACYVPPRTRHYVVNRGTARACYVFVYSLPGDVD